MAKYANLVEYNIKTSLDASGITKLQAELTKVQTSLNSLAGSSKKMKGLGLNVDEVQLYQEEIEKLRHVISNSFNSRTGMLNLSQFNTALKSGVLSVSELNGAFKATGMQGKTAFNSMVAMMTNVNKQAVTVNSTMAKIANTFSNTVRWGITAGIFQEMMSSVQGAVSYMKDLDESLTQIQMVTNSSKENMRELAQYANNAAQALGSTTTDYTNAVKVFVQEGFSEEESKQYANLSTKLANVSEQNTSVTSDQITAFRNAFQLDYEQTVSAMDKVANVANNTASNVNELMTASQRAASVAQAVGSSQESFLAAIATIESVTRQSAEEIGNGLKTIYQRFADIKVGGTTDDGVDYGQYAKALKSIGVDVLDAAGEFKGMDQILKETQEVWSSLSDTMKIAVGEKVAGKFQYNRFAALMNNQAYYEKALAATGSGSEGMMDQMNEYYMDSIEGRLNTLQAAGEQVMSTLFDQDTVEPIIEDVTKFVNGLNSIIEIAGGGIPVFTALSSLLLKAFSPQIAAQMTQIATNIATITQASNNMKNMNEAMMVAGQMGRGIDSKTYTVANKGMSVVQGLDQAAQQKVSAMVQQMAEAEERVENAESRINEIAGQLTTKYQKQLNLTEEQALVLQDQLATHIKDGGLTQAQIHETMRDLGIKEEQLEIIKLTQSEITGAVQAYKEMNNAALSVNQNLNAANTAIKGFESEQIARGFTQALSAVTSLAFGIQSMTSWFSIMNDETASFEEKFNATLISLTMGISMLGSAFTSIKSSIDAISTGLLGAERITAISAVTVATENYNRACIEAAIAQDMVTAAMQAGDIESAKAAGEKVAEAVAIREKTKALQEEAFVQAEKNNLEVISGRVTNESIRTTMASVFADKIKTAAMTEGTIANKLYTISTKMLALANIEATAATASLAATIGMIVAPIAIVVALIAGCVIAYNSWQDSIHAANKKFEEQKDLLKNLKQHYEEVQEKVDSLKESIDSIADKKQTLSDLEEGTLEWKEAVVALNKEVVELLGTYPKLAKYVKNEKGVLSFEEGALDKFYEEQLDIMRSAQEMVTIQQAIVYRASSNSAIEDFVNQNDTGYGILQKENVETIVNQINDGSINIEDACKNLGLDIDKNGDELIALSETVKSNTVATESLNTTLVDTANYQSFAPTPDSEEVYQKAYDALGEKYGPVFNGLDLLTASILDNRNEIANQQDFKDLAQAAFHLEGAVTSIQETAEGWDWEIRTTVPGEELQISKQALQEQLALYQAQQEIARQNFDFDAKIYEALGATFNEESKNFEFTNSSWQPDEQHLQLIKNYQDNTQMMIDGEMQGFADYMKELYPTIEDFAAALKNTEGALFDFGQELDNIQGAVSLSDLDYEYEKSDKTTSNTEDYNKQLDKLTQEAAEAYEIDFEDITGQAKAFREELNLTEGAARELAVQNQRMTKGIDDLHENWEKWSDILQNSNHMAKDYIDATQDATKAIANLVGASDDLELSEEFFKSSQNLEDIASAADGDVDAINRLGIAVGKDLVEAMEAVSKEASGLDFSNADAEQSYTNMVNDFYNAKNIVTSGLDELQAQINNLGIGQNVYDILGGDDWVNALNLMAEQTHMSVEQMNSLLNSIGVQADVTVKHVPTKMEVPEYTTIEEVTTLDAGGPDGSGGNKPARYSKTSYTYVSGHKEVDGFIDVAQINTGDAVGTPPTITYTGNGPVSYSSTPSGRNGSGGGGGGKSPKSGSNKNNQKKEKQKSEWDYLTDITNDLDRAAAIMERLAKLEDRLYGANRVSQLKTLQKQYQNRIKLLRQELKLEENHAKRLRNNARDENGNLTISGYAYRAGVDKLKFDAQNNLDNGREIEQALLKRVNQATEDYNNHRNDNDAAIYDEKLTHAKNDYDGFLKALSEYESTLGKIEDSKSEIQDYKEKIQDAADAIVDSIQEGIDDVLKAMDSQREFNRMYRNWQEGGNSYSHFSNDRKYYTEGLESLLSSDDGQSIFDTQVKSLRDRIKDVEEVFDINKKDKKDADDEKLSQQAAFENLQEATSNVMDSLDKMIDYYDSLLETIQEASDKMDELIDNRLKEFDRLEKYLDTRLDQLALLFGDKSYEEQSQLYNQKIAVNMEKMVSINTAIEQKQATVDVLEKLEASGKKLSTEERKELQDARDKVNELQEEQLDTETKLLQDIADKLKAQTSAEMNKLVNSLFNDTDVDWLSEQWEIATRNSEKYLDDYNRAFELQKLQLKFQEALNDSQNSSLATQQKIVALGDEYLTYLREKNNLSEYDVKHAQMELDILQKQIALEDARNNKSQMQLQRNAAGNYDFVYAADEKAVNQAAEALLAAQQESYNLSKKMYLDTYQSAFEAATKTKEMVVQIATDASVSVEERTERIKFVLDNLNEYLSGSSVELGEISLNLYNSFAEAEQLIAEENQGNLSAIFEQMRQDFTALVTEINQTLEDSKETSAAISENLIETAENTSSTIGDSVNKTTEDIASAFGNMATTGSENFGKLVSSITSEEGTGGHLQAIKHGVVTKADEIHEYISNTTLKNIDSRFETSKEAIIGIVGDINSKIEEAFNKITGTGSEPGYLGEFESKTEEALELANDSYTSFTEDSIDYTTEHLGTLIGSTQDWKDNLTYLNEEIKNCAEEVKEWKKQIDFAINAVGGNKGLIKRSNDLQKELGGVATKSTKAAYTLEVLGYSADYATDASFNAADACYAVAEAADSAASSARDAADAYRDMASAAASAALQEAAAQEAHIARINNLGKVGSFITPTGNSSSYEDYYDNIWKVGNTYNFGMASGGYTGNWFDNGVDNQGGKWAVLHQKELVLNATDTKNMLSAIEIVRDIMSGINSLSSIGKMTSQNSYNDTIEQRVEINATFPGVTEAIEIKQALEQLADNAYQAANKYKY